jgi:poly-gamma-glutamate synthesis protein (capsule biosynthesis protein)
MWSRRQFLQISGGVLAVSPDHRSHGSDGSVTLFLAGDVMTGRGIDQVLPRPSRPQLHEDYVRSALDYVDLAERAHGRISRPATASYVWGDLLSDLERRSPDFRIVNLETSVTTSEEALPKGINYRMHPANVPCLSAARIDCCVLANNHILDWGGPGLRETLEALAGAQIATAGAGRTAEDAGRPAVLATSGRGRVLVFGFGMPSSGIPHDWAASETRPGVNLLPDSSARSVSRAVEQIQRWKSPGDRVVASIHWGGNWGTTYRESSGSWPIG